MFVNDGGREPLDLFVHGEKTLELKQVAPKEIVTFGEEQRQSLGVLPPRQLNGDSQRVGNVALKLLA